MDRSRHRWLPLAALLVLAALTAGCAAAHQRVAPGTSSAPVPAITAQARLPAPGPATAPVSGRGGRGGSVNGPQTAAGGLPADWPPDLPLPPGSISGSTGSAGRWSVLILAPGSAAEVRRSTVALYSAAGFTSVSDSVLNKGNRQVTVVVENRDHSATQTNLMIGVTTR